MLSLRKYVYLVKTFVLVVALAFSTQAQNYAPLFTNGTFNKTVNVNLPVGDTTGEAGVSPVGGSTYTIPIVAPPGTNGVVPSVALAYNSMGGNSIMGMGWSISGLSMISRVPRSIYQDGSAGSVELNADDRFALDGMRLVATSGSYGGNGTVYATESETFARITSYNTGGVAGTSWFKVEAKDGTVMEYGTTADSRRNADSQSPTLFWLLKRIKYPDGNYIELNYISPLAPMISEINYTGNSNTGQTPYNRIKFEYTGRNDNNVAYEAGVSVYGDFLLDKVIVTADNQTTRTYQLNYGFDNINSYLREITEKGSDGSSLNSTIFKYGEIPQNFESYPVLGLEQSITTSSGDFDGDGYTDIIEKLVGYSDGIAYNQGFKIHKRTANNTNYVLAHQKTFPTTFQIVGRANVPNFYNFLANDFTGDGTDDVAVANMVINSTTRTFTSLKIYSGETGFASEIDIPTYPNYTKVHASGNYILPGDFNGDGVQDILTMLAFGSSDAYASHLYYGKISNSFGTVAITGTHNLGMNTWPRANKTLVLDFNGDGKSDLMVISNYECEIFTFDGYVAKRIYQGDFPTKDHLIYLGDFNGDRKTDLLVRASLTNNNVAWQQAISTGKVFFRGGLSFQKQPNVTGTYSTNQGEEPGPGAYSTDHLTIADFNGDGKTDIYHGWTPEWGTSVLDVYYSRGLSFQHVSHNTSMLLGAGDSQPFDLNGDGRADLMNRASFPAFFHSLTFRPNGKEHLLEKVANGHGHTTEWAYKRLNEEGAFYQRGNLENDPFNNIQLPMYAVAELKAQNGIGGVSTVQYAYEEAKIHKRGKGFMGFKKSTASNLTMGVRTVTEMQFNSYPLAAALYQTSSYLIANGQLLNQTTLNNEFVAYGSQFSSDKRYWQRVNSSTQNNAFEGRTVSSSFSYDSHGNVTQSSVNNNNLATTTTTANYGAFATPVPARPTSTTVTIARSGQPPYSLSTTFGYNGLGQLTNKTEFAGLPKSTSAPARFR